MLDPVVSHYRIRHGLAYCVSNDRTIFLDIVANRYFGLPRSLDEVFQRFLSTDPCERVELAELAPLIQASIVLADDHPTSDHSHHPIVQPLRELRHNGAATGRLMQANCIVAQIRASLRLRRKSLAWLPKWADERRKTSTGNGAFEDGWKNVASAFASTAILRSRSDSCLSSSIAFLDIGLSDDLDAQLVFGVYSSPFSAHCWVQVGDIVLNDRIETVRAFTPILAV